jgi:hypothetical protein
MPKREYIESRYDFSGGLHTSCSPDAMAPNELRQAQNVRLSSTLKAVEKRGGTQYMHSDSLANNVIGIYQWDAPSGKQLVAITAAGGLYYKTLAASTWTSASTNIFATALTPPPRVFFQPARGSASGAALKLYIAVRKSATTGVYASWDGSSLVNLTGTNGLPSAPTWCVAYHTRMFLGDALYPNHLFWTDVGDMGAADGTGITGGGSAIVATLGGDSLLGATQVGSSLALFTDDSVGRLTGYSNNDVQIAQDTEGIAAQTGAVGSKAWCNVEDYVAFLSERGVYLMAESGIQLISAKIQDILDGLNRYWLNGAILAYHRGRRELWLAVPPSAAVVNTYIYVYSMQAQAWTGPFVHGLGIYDLRRFEDSVGDEYLMCSMANFCMIMDCAHYTDFADYTGANGVGFSTAVELAPFFGEPGPVSEKIWDRMKVRAYVPANSQLQPAYAVDATSSFSNTTATIDAAAVTLPNSYRIDFYAQGDVLRLKFYENGVEAGWTLNGVQLRSYDMLRNF